MKPARQRAFVRVPGLLKVLLGVVLLYGLIAAWGPARTYWRVRTAAQDLVDRGLLVANPEQFVQSFTTRVHDETGLVLFRRDILFSWLSANELKVSVRIHLPIELPLIGKQWREPVAINATAVRLGSH